MKKFYHSLSFLMAMMVVMQRWDNVGILSILFLALSIGLYLNWYRHLSEEIKLD